MKSWLDRFIEWGLNRAERPWGPSTAAAYRGHLRRLERDVGKPLEDLTAEDLRTYQARHRSVSAATWGRTLAAINGFYEYLRAQGARDDDPSKVLTRRRIEKAERPIKDVLGAIARIEDETDRRMALFLYHSALEIGEATSISEPPVDGRVHVLRRGGRWEWVPLRPEALAVLEQLGGRMPFKDRTVQKRLPLKPREIKAAGERDHQLRSSHEDALGPVWALLANRPHLLEVARSYRDAVEAMEAVRPRPRSAITAAARALQGMLTAMGAEGNSLGPLAHSARAKGLFGPYDSKLAVALDEMVDWVSADRSGRGDAHKLTDPSPEDAWLAIRVVAALLLRLESAMQPQEAGGSG